MKNSGLLRLLCRYLLLPLLASALLAAAPRDAEWKRVGQLLQPDAQLDPLDKVSPAKNPFEEQALTEQASEREVAAELDSLLVIIQATAFAEHAWAEGVNALALRIYQKNPRDGGLADIIKFLGAEIAVAPAEVKPILRCLQAHYYLIYHEQNERTFSERSPTTGALGDDFETWDLTRIVQQIDKCFHEALVDKAITQKIPVAAFEKFFGKPDLGDDLRPTLYDFIAHSALQFGLLRPSNHPLPEKAFAIGADSPVFGSVDEFLLWNPATEDKESPTLLALHVLQDLLAFHKKDADPGAFLHCNLERIRWAYLVAEGPQRAQRFDTCIRSFIDTHASHPLSADARQDIARILLKMNKLKEARDFSKIGADAFPNHPFGKQCQRLVDDIERKNLELVTRSDWTPAGAAIRVKHANVQHVWFRAYRQEWSIEQAVEGGDDRPKSLALLKTKPELAWDAVLPDDKDFKHRDTTLSAPKNLAPGYYLIVASGNSDFSTEDNSLSTARVYVTNLMLIVDDDGAPLLTGFVADALTGRPMKGIKVECWQRDWRSPARSMPGASTDHDGAFNIPTALTDNQVIIAASNGEHRAVTCFQNRNYKQQIQSKSSAKKEVEESVLILTDRAIYRPGQTIQFKGILSESNKANGSHKTLAGRKVSAVLCGPKKEEIGKVDAVTNEYGSFSQTFTAPGGNLAGEYSINVGGDVQTTVAVEEYKRPKFHVRLMPPETPPQLDKPTAIRGLAQTYTGAAVNGALVKWRLSRGTRWADCWNDVYGYWGMPGSRGDAADIASGTLTTDALGSFTIPFTAAASRSVDPAIEPVFCFTVEVECTDPTGETRDVEYTLPVGYASMCATLATDAWQEESKPVIFKIHTTALDEKTNLPASGTLRIYQLKEPEAGPPDDRETSRVLREKVLRGEAPGDLIREVQVTTDKSGTATTPVDLPVGRYLAVFLTKDANAHPVRTLGGVTVINPSSGKFSLKIPFLTIAPKSETQPGQPFKLLWGSCYPGACARIDWFKNGVLLKREWSAPDRSQQLFSFTPDDSMRGGFEVRVTQTTLNDLKTFAKTIDVPWPDNGLTLRWEHLTSKLQPAARDTWTAVITGPEGKPAAAEMVATLYDASLDSIREHGYYNPWAGSGSYSSYSYYPAHSSNSFSFAQCRDWTRRSWITDSPHYYRKFSGLPNDYNPWHGDACMSILGSLRDNDDYAPAERRNGLGGGMIATPATPPAFGFSSNDSPDPGFSRVTARRNLQETAFFLPHLTSNDKGEVRITFTMPEALTKWKFLGFAHDKNMRSGTLEGETITAKDLMVQPNPPRFLREGDALNFTVKISNQSDKQQAGTARLTLADAATQKDATAALGITAPDQQWSIPANESRTLSWHLKVPDGSGFLTYKALATTGTLSDGEEGLLPIIPRRVLLTESMALPIRDAGTKEFSFQKLIDSSHSTTLENRFVHLQVVSQPAWYAVMALPYLMEFPHECAEQTFNRYYANTLARHIATSNPKIRRIFDLWKNSPATDSPLTKNADIKGILLEETPWLNEATSQSHARHKLGLLLDDNQLGGQLEFALKKLAEMQHPGGLWPWFPGAQSNEFITLYITTGFARLRALGVNTDITPALKALPALDACLTRRLAAIKTSAAKDPDILKANHFDSWAAHHLYTRTFFLKDCEVKIADKEAFEYFTAQAKQYWRRLGSRMSRAHAALALARIGDLTSARLITRSLRDSAVIHEESGMSWKDAASNDPWAWWQAPIESQAMMIEAFREIDHDAKAVAACQVWLIKQKQVRDWKSTKATADAIHALLMGGNDLLGNNALLQVSLGGMPVKPEAVEPGTGFYEARFAGPAVTHGLGNIRLTKTDPGVAWASIHWQYLEDMSKISPHNATPLKLEKTLYVRKSTPQGLRIEPVSGPVKVGDELVTRLVLRNDRTIEFVHLKDQHGSGTEPVNVPSGYRWQDGFGYYEVTRDTASHFFIDTLPAGIHVFESSVRVQHSGTYQTGCAEIRCMYAPEFNAHTASILLEVTK